MSVTPRLGSSDGKGTCGRPQGTCVADGQAMHGDMLCAPLCSLIMQAFLFAAECTRTVYGSANAWGMRRKLRGSMPGHCVGAVRLLSPGSRRNPAAYLVPTVCYGPGSSNRDFTCWCAGRKCNFAFDLLSPLSSEDENVVPHSLQSLLRRNAISRRH